MLDIDSKGPSMSHEERTAVAGIVANLLIMGAFAWRLSAMAAAGRFDGPDALVQWARTILWAIPAGIGLLIVLMILSNILFAAATRDGNPSFVVDERDRAIERQGLRVSLAVGTGGFLGGIVLLALGIGPLTALNVMAGASATGSLLGDVARLWLYRRGL